MPLAGRDPRSPQAGPYAYTPPSTPAAVAPVTNVKVDVFVDSELIASKIERMVEDALRLPDSLAMEITSTLVLDSNQHSGRGKIAQWERAKRINPLTTSPSRRNLTGSNMQVTITPGTVG
jgi:hypothetical protein